jgi:hypothetical protein
MLRFCERFSLVALVVGGMIATSDASFAATGQNTCLGPRPEGLTVPGSASGPLRQITDAHPLGGSQVANAVRDALVFAPDRAPEAVALLSQSAAAVQRAVASGLGQAAGVCATRNAPAAEAMRVLVAQLGNTEIAQAFSSGSSQVLPAPLAALDARCFTDTPPVPEAEARRITTNPGLLLSENPLGGAALSTIVRNLAISDPANAIAVLSILSSANPNQAASIAAGLGQATMACEVRAPNVAQAIQRFVANSSDPRFQAVFQSVVGSPVTATIAGPRGGISPGGGGGGPLGNTGVTGVGLVAEGAISNAARRTVFQFSVDPSSVTNTRSRSAPVFQPASP